MWVYDATIGPTQLLPLDLPTITANLSNSAVCASLVESVKDTVFPGLTEEVLALPVTGAALPETCGLDICNAMVCSASLYTLFSFSALVDATADATICVAAAFTALLNLVFCFFNGFLPPLARTLDMLFLFLYASVEALIAALPAALFLQSLNSFY